MKTENVKGFKDYIDESAAKRAAIREIIEKVFKNYGFEVAETPIIEYEEFVKGENSGDEAVSDIFKLQDRGKRKLALRYEFTFQLKRLAKGQKLPYKRYQIGSVFRDEPIKAGRFREFTQCDADIIGSSEIVADAEILALVKAIFDKLGLKVRVQVNNRQLLNAIVESLGIRERKTELSIIREIDKLEKNRDEAYRNLTKILGKDKRDQLLDYFDKDLKFFIGQEFSGAADIKELRRLCKLYGIGIVFAPSLARGLSYYTGNIFEIFSPKYDLSIAAGGRYELDGISSVGISFGLDRISELAKVDFEKTNCLIISINQDETAIKLAEQLRKKGKNCSIMFGRITKALEYANAKKIDYVVFIGEKEAKKKKIRLRDMKTGKEKLVTAKSLVKELK